MASNGIYDLQIYDKSKSIEVWTHNLGAVPVEVMGHLGHCLRPLTCKRPPIVIIYYIILLSYLEKNNKKK